MVQFDAALAFVMLLLLMSLVVTALVQAAIALFDIRGGNLKSALTTILEQSGLSAKAEDLAKKVVTHPAIRGAVRSYRAKAVSKEELRELLKAFGVGDDSLREVDRWFDAVMNRSSDWFVAKTRGWTVALSFFLAVGMGVDAIDTYGRLTRDPALRAGLVASTDAVLRQAEKTLDGAPIRLAAERVASSGAGGEVLQRIPSELESCRQAEAWLASAQPPPTGAVHEQFKKACEEESRKLLTGAAAKLTSLNEQLQAGSIELTWIWSKPEELNPRKVLGMLLTGILLSLGAPFWFGVLRQMATLRPPSAEKANATS